MDQWHLTGDVDEFLERAGDYLRSRPVPHTMPLTATARGYVPGRTYGWHDEGGFFYGAERLTLGEMSADKAESLAAFLQRAGHPVTSAGGDQRTSAAFAEAWTRHTGATAVRNAWLHLYRLGALTPPDPFPAGRAVERDHDQVVRWCGDFMAAVGETPAATWAESRFAGKRFLFWEAPDGTTVSMAAATPMIAGMVRVDPVFTPAHLRGHGYAAAVTVAVSRAALEQGATDVVLFTDPANPTSNALYRRLGYVRFTDFEGSEFR